MMKTKPKGLIQPRAFPVAVRARLAPVWVTVDEKKAVDAAVKRAGLSIRRAVEETVEREGGRS